MSKLKPMRLMEVIVGTNKEIIKSDPELQKSLQCIENPIAPQRLKKLQQQDTNIETFKMQAATKQTGQGVLQPG